MPFSLFYRTAETKSFGGAADEGDSAASAATSHLSETIKRFSAPISRGTYCGAADVKSGMNCLWRYI